MQPVELIEAITKDPHNREVWKAHIAQSFKDVWDNWDFHKFPKGIIKGKDIVPDITELANKAADNFLYSLQT